MNIIKAGYEILSDISAGGIKELQHIERIGRICYKSEDKITDDDESAKKFVAGLIKRGHEAMLEHSILTVLFVVDRGVSHEIVRHRMASFAQESTRYCNYTKGKFGGELTCIKPFTIEQDSLEYIDWCNAMYEAELDYNHMIACGVQPQIARSVLPNSLKTEIVMTANYREWRHFFWLRAADVTGPAHPQMHEVAQPLLDEVHSRIPIVFDDVWTVMHNNLNKH